MPMQVVNGAQLSCAFGTSPSSLTVLPAGRPICNSQPAANVLDYVPMVNVMPFGMCISPTNPQVAAATAAALGVLTPQPCIPATSAPWTPGSVTQVAGQSALNDVSICTCQWAGVISVVSAQSITEIP
jgi:hypothetical protein